MTQLKAFLYEDIWEVKTQEIPRKHLKITSFSLHFEELNLSSKFLPFLIILE
jgi:hypothetical protein